MDLWNLPVNVGAPTSGGHGISAPTTLHFPSSPRTSASWPVSYGASHSLLSSPAAPYHTVSMPPSHAVSIPRALDHHTTHTHVGTINASGSTATKSSHGSIVDHGWSSWGTIPPSPSLTPTPVFSGSPGLSVSWNNTAEISLDGGEGIMMGGGAAVSRGGRRGRGGRGRGGRTTGSRTRAKKHDLTPMLDPSLSPDMMMEPYLKIPIARDIRIKPHQISTLLLMLRVFHEYIGRCRGIMLGLDMGLGKTSIAIFFHILYRRALGFGESQDILRSCASAPASILVTKPLEYKEIPRDQMRYVDALADVRFTAGAQGVLKPSIPASAVERTSLDAHNVSLSFDVIGAYSHPSTERINRMNRPLSHNVAIVIVPNHLITQWANEIKKFRGTLTRVLVFSPDEIDINKVTYYDICNSDFVVVTYDTLGAKAAALKAWQDQEHDDVFTPRILPKDWEERARIMIGPSLLFHVEYALKIVDEGEMVTNPQTRRWKSVMAVPSLYNVGLSGTPIKNDGCKDMYALMRVCGFDGIQSIDGWSQDVYRSLGLRDHVIIMKKSEAGIVLPDVHTIINEIELTEFECEVYKLLWAIRQQKKTGDRHLKLKILIRLSQCVVAPALIALPHSAYKDIDPEPSGSTKRRSRRDVDESRDDGIELEIEEEVKCKFTQEQIRMAAKIVNMYSENDEHFPEGYVPPISIEKANEIINESECIDQILPLIYEASLKAQYRRLRPKLLDFEGPAGLGSTKIRAILQLMEQLRKNVVEKGRIEKAIVFCTLDVPLQWMERLLHDHGYGNYVIYYSAKIKDRKERDALIHTFKHDPNKLILLANYASMARGHNLTEANIAVKVDPWWAPTADEQSLCRIYRIGQVRKVCDVHLVAKGTIDEKKQKIAHGKNLDSDDWLDGDRADTAAHGIIVSKITDNDDHRNEVEVDEHGHGESKSAKGGWGGIRKKKNTSTTTTIVSGGHERKFDTSLRKGGQVADLTDKMTGMSVHSTPGEGHVTSPTPNSGVHITPPPGGVGWSTLSTIPSPSFPPHLGSPPSFSPHIGSHHPSSTFTSPTIQWSTGATSPSTPPPFSWPPSAAPPYSPSSSAAPYAPSRPVGSGIHSGSIPLGTWWENM